MMMGEADPTPEEQPDGFDKPLMPVDITFDVKG